MCNRDIVFRSSLLGQTLTRPDDRLGLVSDRLQCRERKTRTLSSHSGQTYSRIGASLLLVKIFSELLGIHDSLPLFFEASTAEPNCSRFLKFLS